MANEEMTMPQAPAPTPAQEPASAEGKPAVPGMPGAMEENPLDKVSGGNPLVRQVKSQLFGLEKQRARSDEVKTINERSIEELRNVVIDEFQQFLEENGVDVANPEAIKAFIEAVRTVNPDMVILIETIFRTLQEEEGGIDVGVLSANRDLKKRFGEVKSKMAEAEAPMEEGAEMEGAEMEGAEMEGAEMETEEEAPPMPMM